MASKSPDAFRTISEVADWLGVQPHVLRFWESKFSQVKPVKRAGGRRYYRPNDMLLLGGIKQLLHEDGLTIKGAQKILREQGMAHVATLSKPLDEESAALAEEAAAAPNAEQDVPEAGFVEAPEEDTPVAEFPSIEEPTPDGEAAPAVPPEPVAEAPGFEDAPLSTDAASADADPAETETPSDDATLMDQSDPAEPAPTFDTADDSPSEDTEAPTLPSFITEAPADPVPTAEDNLPPVQPEAASVEELPDAQPEFENFDAPSEPVDDTDAAPEPEPTVADAADAAPRPLVVDAPDPDEASLTVSPGVLSTAFRVSDTADEQNRAALTPLVAQLAALRDRMAAARGR